VRELPTGTLTLLFTDVEGSTSLLRAHGATYAELLAEHRRLLRDVCARHGGVEVDTQGDAFFFVFRAAGDAASAAEEGQNALAATPVRVRMGLHTGEPVATDEGYVGLDVHHAARVAACGHGGQIVVSASTRALVGGTVELRDLGEHRLKDLGAPERLFQLGDGTFAPLRTLDATNLPLATSPLVGREQELAEVLALLTNGSREVTVTGPGGTGKTRFALQVAAELVGRFRDGVIWVPLAALAEPELVEPEIAQAIGARESLTGFLQGKELLLLLDNFEHVLEAAPTVATLLASAGGLRVLATSRSPLHLSGEREYPLDPLPPSDAATLFVERARAVGREVAPDETVAAICRRLDGLPLAVELAAARTKLLTPEKLLERLDRALPLLTGGARDAPERQRTLRTTIAWSYDLLDEECRRLFARLSVFAGGFPLEAAEVVCDAELETLAALVDASLLKAIGDDRFLLLETVREFAAERLADEGETDAFRRRHAHSFAALAEEAYAGHFEHEVEWSSRLERDHDDLRAALDWLTAAGEAEAVLLLAGALGWFWLSHGHLVEGDRRLERALARPTTEARGRARALTAAAQLAGPLTDVERGQARIDEALMAWKRLGDDFELANAMDALGWFLVYYAGDEEGALAAFEESMSVHRANGDEQGGTRALVGVCQVLVALGAVERAESLSNELLALAQAQDDPRAEHFAFHFLADCALIEGECETADDRYRRSLEAALPLGDVIETSAEIQGLAMAAAGRGQPERALVLAGAIEALWESLGIAISIRFWDALLDRYLGAARNELGAKADAYWAQGRTLDLDRATALALSADLADGADPAD
jgi:predicted ATPase/class 3 adenylate cyclase